MEIFIGLLFFHNLGLMPLFSFGILPMPSKVSLIALLGLSE